MIKRINLTATEFTAMGWNLMDEDAALENVVLVIDTTLSTMRLENENGDDLAGYKFEYMDALQDLDDHGHLAGGVGNASLIFNDWDECRSTVVFPSSVAEIIEMPELVVKVYNGVNELNEDIYGMSFSRLEDTPMFEMEDESENEEYTELN